MRQPRFIPYVLFKQVGALLNQKTTDLFNCQAENIEARILGNALTSYTMNRQ